MPAPSLATLQTLFNVYDGYPVECDGMTRILHARLVALGIEHSMYVGRVENKTAGTAFAPHFFIELPTQQGEAIIDYCARRVLGMQSAHGVFLRTSTTHMIYRGEAFDEVPLSEGIIAVMLAPIPADIQSRLAMMNQQRASF